MTNGTIPDPREPKVDTRPTLRDVDLRRPVPAAMIREREERSKGKVRKYAYIDRGALSQLLNEDCGAENWGIASSNGRTLDVIETTTKDGYPAYEVTAACDVTVWVDTTNGRIQRSASGVYNAIHARRSGGIRQALASAETQGFKRAASLIGRRFGGDLGRLGPDVLRDHSNRWEAALAANAGQPETETTTDGATPSPAT